MEPLKNAWKLAAHHYVWTPIEIIVALVLTLLIVPLREFHSQYPVSTFVGGLLFLLLVFSTPLLAVGGAITNYEIRSKSLFGLFLLYLELIVLFAVIYYLFVLLDSSFIHLEGVHQVWWKLEGKETIRLTEYAISNAFSAFLDCLHFSVVTTATVGYGDMVPKSTWLKLIVDAHIVLSTGLVILGFGKYFSSLK